ncbi:MAG TPA: hypothetical protein VL422_02005 [Miltoncostaea sp.]|nr:hypothetical protein [Miltoncostaea sp.]
MDRTGRGQAAVESIGSTVAIALLKAALAVWMAGNVRPTGPPPDVIGRVADPLGLSARRVEQAWSRDDLPRWLDTEAVGRGDRPIGRFLAATGRGAVAVGGAGLAAGWNFRRHVERRVVERVGSDIHDPWSLILSPPDPSMLSPVGMARHVVGRLGDPVAYVRSLRGLSARGVAMRVSGDAGDLVGDVIVDAGEAYLARRVTGALRRGGSAGPSPGGRDAPGP